MRFVHKCHLCGEAFTKKGEEVYCVNNLILDESKVDGQLHWRWVEEGPATENRPHVDGITRIECWFHRKCFESVAGTEYLSMKCTDG